MTKSVMETKKSTLDVPGDEREKGKEDISGLRIRALNIFLEHAGSIKNSEIARMLGLHRTTVSKWRKGDGWETKLTETRHLTDKKIVEKAATVLADKVTPEYTDIMQNMAGVNAIVRAKLVARDDKGDPIRNPDGSLRANTSLTASDLRGLQSTLESYLKSIRLIMGQSTENQNHSGEVEHKPGAAIDSGVEELAREVLKTGSPDAQEAMNDLIKAMQKVRTVKNGFRLN